MRICPTCGAEVDDTAAFCINCGASMAGVPVQGANSGDQGAFQTASPMDTPFGQPAAPVAPAGPTVDEVFGQQQGTQAAGFGQTTGYGQAAGFGQDAAQAAGFAQSAADANYQQNYQQNYQNTYNQPQGAPQQYYQAPAMQPLPPAYNNTDSETVSVGDWMVAMLLMCIPIVNLILLCVWAFGSDAPASKSNWAKAQLIWMLIGVILSIVLVIIFGASMAAIMTAIN